MREGANRRQIEMIAKNVEERSEGKHVRGDFVIAPVV
jgi:hypothetical protein